MSKKLVRIFTILLSSSLCTQNMSFAMNRPKIKRASSATKITKGKSNVSAGKGSERKNRFNRGPIIKYGIPAVLGAGAAAGGIGYAVTRSKSVGSSSSSTSQTSGKPVENEQIKHSYSAPHVVVIPSCIKYDENDPSVFKFHHLLNSCYVNTFLVTLYNSPLVDWIRNIDVNSPKCSKELKSLCSIVKTIDDHGQIDSLALDKYFRDLGWDGSQDCSSQMFIRALTLVKEYFYGEKSSFEDAGQKIEVSRLPQLADDDLKKNNSDVQLTLNQIINAKDNAEKEQNIRVFGSTAIVDVQCAKNVLLDEKDEKGNPKCKYIPIVNEIHNFQEFNLTKNNEFLIDYNKKCKNANFKIKAVGLHSGSATGGHWIGLLIKKVNNAYKYFVCDDMSNAPYEITENDAMKLIHENGRFLVYDVTPIDAQTIDAQNENLPNEIIINKANEKNEKVQELEVVKAENEGQKVVALN